MSTPNAALAYLTLDHIDAHPESWDQRRWWCGTSGCFAGWTVTLSGKTVVLGGYVRIGPGPDDIAHVSQLAAQLLGFDDQWTLDETAFDILGQPDDDEYALFSSDNTREDLGRIVEAVFGPRPEGGSGGSVTDGGEGGSVKGGAS